MSDEKPKKDKAPATVIGTAGKINRLLLAHSAAERKRILDFLGAETAA